MNDISSARMAVARQRPQSTDPTLTVRSYDAKLGTNVHNYWKKSQKKPPAESHAPVALDQGIFNQPGPACDMPSFEQGDISLKPNLSFPKHFPILKPHFPVSDSHTLSHFFFCQDTS